MMFLYTMEGYLYLKLNSHLWNSDKSGFENIVYYYTCLLASFEYFSKNTKFNQNHDLVVYRASKFSEEEFQVYDKKNNTIITRNFKEFVSTSKDPNVLKKFSDLNNPNINEFLWEITIPSYIIRTEPNNFADISEFSQLPDEREILIRSGSIIKIEKIIPFTEEIEGKIKEYPNKFK